MTREIPEGREGENLVIEGEKIEGIAEVLHQAEEAGNGEETIAGDQSVTMIVIVTETGRGADGTGGGVTTAGRRCHEGRDR